VLPARTQFPTNSSMAPSASASSQVPSVSRPTPLGARHDSGEPDNPIEMRPLDHTDPSAENRDPSDNSA
jgi:hypothetical protein